MRTAPHKIRRPGAAGLRAALAAALFCALIACGGGEDGAYVQVQSGPLRTTLVESGDVSAVHSQMVQAPMEWRDEMQIVELAEEGSIAQKGDVVVRIDTGFLQKELEEIGARLESDREERKSILAQQASRRQSNLNAVTTAELSREQAELSVEKLRYESESRRQSARMDLSSALVSLEEARAKLTAQAILDSLELARSDLTIADAEERLAAARDQVEEFTLRAPLTGMVIHAEFERDGKLIKAREGEKVHPGFSIVEIPDLSRMQVEFQVNEVDRHRIEEGMPVRVSLEAFPDRRYEGKVREIARLASPQTEDSSVKIFAVRAPLDSGDELLRPGMTAVVEVELAQHDEGALVPLSAIFEREGQAVVFPRAQWPRARNIEIIASDALFARVEDQLEAGLDLATAAPLDDPLVVSLGWARYLESRVPTPAPEEEQP